MEATTETPDPFEKRVSLQRISPQLEHEIILLIFQLRDLGDVAASEKVRIATRKALENTATRESAEEEVNYVIKKAKKKISKLDGSYERIKRRKLEKREEAMQRASKFIDASASEGDDDEEVETENESDY
ncbi:hypothetical protein AGDE_03210 [Angomonas deanei]|nr:hypothetical protein AGDE_03210 [Angomonas deanei]|eukprot:EPY40717.1 hypothetical protein AGDE_03210 [Angomonas deanei]